jgi:hypothetical protein
MATSLPLATELLVALGLAAAGAVAGATSRSEQPVSVKAAVAAIRMGRRWAECLVFIRIRGIDVLEI